MKTCFQKLLLLSAIVVSLASSGLATAQNFNCWPVTRVAAGANHSLFTKSDGTLFVMGDNSFGQLGLGPVLTSVNVPQPLTNGVSTLSAGQAHSLFVMNRALWAMGDNSGGELGDGTTTTRYFPEQVFALGRGLNFTGIAAGGYHSLFATASLTGGTLRSMGDNDLGELGDGTYISESTPEIVLTSSPGAVAKAAAGGYSHNLLIRADGTLWGMGSSESGQLGSGPFSILNLPEPLGTVSNFVVAVAAGYAHSLYIKPDGSLWATGSSTYGQLGDGSVPSKFSEVQILPGNVVAVAAGYYHSLIIESDGSLWGMGMNEYGQLGDGTSTDRNIPELIVPGNVVAVAAGEFHSFFIMSDGSLWGMGYNGYGQLGTGDYVDRHVPVEIVAPPPLLNIAAASSNLVFTWPSNAVGFALYSTTDLTPPATWTSNSVTPVLVGNQFVVTNPVSGPRKYFRLGL